MIVSTFTEIRDNVPKEVDISWETFASSLGPHDFSLHPEAKEQGALPCFSPAHYPPGKPAQAHFVVSLSFGVLDLDHVTGDQMLAVLDKAKAFNSVFYTTWNHAHEQETSGLWRARICVQFSRPVQASEWKQFWPKLVGYFGMVADPKCKNPDRRYYGAFAPAGTESNAHFVTFSGRPLDVDSLRLGDSAAPLAAGTDKIPRDRLERLATRWKRSRDEWRATMGEALQRVCKGEPFAESGSRDTTAFQLAQDLAEAFPNAIPESIAAHFAQSLQLMGTHVTVEMVTEKLARALGTKQQEIQAAQEEELTEQRLRIRQAFAHLDPGRDWPYTDIEVGQMATKLDISQDELRKRWIIQRGNLYYFLGPQAKYSEAYSDKEALSAAVRDLAPARSRGVELVAQTENGAYRKNLVQLMNDYGSVANTYVLDMRAQESTYDPVLRQFTEATCPLRPLTPSYDKDVAAWIELLCGSKTPDVLNWMALATSLDETCAALMFTGAKGTGKSLFAHGMARLWRTAGPVPLESAMGDFNDQIPKCPLVFGDEKLPKDFRGYSRTAELREFIAARTRPFKKKFYPETVCLGAIRLVIAANNEDILAIAENLSVNDIEAVGDRFYHVRVNKEAGEFLSHVDAKTFVTDDRLARHALWLRDNWQIRRDGRFLIRSSDRSFYRALTTKSGIRSALCQWLVGYLKEPRKCDASSGWLVRIHEGRLYVTTEGILRSWDLYVTNEGVPTTGKLAQAISGLSREDRRLLPKPDGKRQNYREIDLDHVKAWAQETEFATVEEIDDALRTDTESRVNQSRVALRPISANGPSN